MSIEARVRTGHTQAPSEELSIYQEAGPHNSAWEEGEGKVPGTQRRVNSCGVSIRASEEEKDVDQEDRGAGLVRGAV